MINLCAMELIRIMTWWGFIIHFYYLFNYLINNDLICDMI